MPVPNQFLWKVAVEGWSELDVIATDFYQAAQKAKKSIVDGREKNKQIDPNALIVTKVERGIRVYI